MKIISDILILKIMRNTNNFKAIIEGILNN